MMDLKKREMANYRLINAIPVYPNTFRRQFIDFAAKITSGARNVYLKVTKAVHESINIEELWKRCGSPPKIAFQ